MPESAGSEGAVPAGGGGGAAPSTAGPATPTPSADVLGGGLGTRSGEGEKAAPPAWAGTLSNFVISTVGTVKAKATVRVVTVLRLVVYGVVVLAALVTAGLLLLIGVVRIWDVYVPLQPLGRRVWLGYVVFGGALFLTGLWLLAGSRKKT
jgi:hypothetical protein